MHLRAHTVPSCRCPLFYKRRPSYRGFLRRVWSKSSGRSCCTSCNSRRDASPLVHAMRRKIERLGEKPDITRERLRAMLEEHESAREELNRARKNCCRAMRNSAAPTTNRKRPRRSFSRSTRSCPPTNEKLRYRVRELTDLHADVARARDYADAIIEIATEPTLVLDGELRTSVAGSKAVGSERVPGRDGDVTPVDPTPPPRAWSPRVATQYASMCG